MHKMYSCAASMIFKFIWFQKLIDFHLWWDGFDVIYLFEKPLRDQYTYENLDLDASGPLFFCSFCTNDAAVCSVFSAINANWLARRQFAIKFANERTFILKKMEIYRNLWCFIFSATIKVTIWNDLIRGYKYQICQCGGEHMKIKLKWASRK